MCDFDDETAWLTYPQHNWVYNKLLLYQKLGYEVAPHGVTPRRFPVISKPIVNIWGLGLGVERWCSAADVKYQAGYLWMTEFTGDWMSYDLDFDTGTVWQATAQCDKIWQARPSAWHVKKSRFEDLPKKLIQDLEKIQIPVKQINLETLGGNIIEVHLRWSFEFAQWRDRDEFWVDVLWSDSGTSTVPEGWMELHDENRSIQISEARPYRLAHRRR